MISDSKRKPRLSFQGKILRREKQLPSLVYETVIETKCRQSISAQSTEDSKSPGELSTSSNLFKLFEEDLEKLSPLYVKLLDIPYTLILFGH